MIEPIQLVRLAGIPTTASHRVRVTTWSSLDADAAISVRISQIDTAGNYTESVEEYTTDVNTFPLIRIIPIAPGSLVGVSVTTTTPEVIRGQILAQISLQAGDVAQSSANAILTAGYIEPASVLAYPASEPSNPTALLNPIIEENPSNPAVGQIRAYNTNGSGTTMPVYARFQLVTDANVANRRVSLVFRNSGSLDVALSAKVNQAASLTYTYVCGHGLASATDDTANNIYYIGIPDDFEALYLTWRFIALNIQAGDQLQNIRIGYRAHVLPDPLS